MVINRGVAVPIEIVHRDYVGVGGVGQRPLLQATEGVWVLVKSWLSTLTAIRVGVLLVAQVAGFTCYAAAANTSSAQRVLSRVPLVKSAVVWRRPSKTGESLALA